MHFKNINTIAKEIDNTYHSTNIVERLTKYVIQSEKFNECSGSSHPDLHHYGCGQLRNHTEEVVNSCLCIRDLYKYHYDIDETELFLAALYHDYGKIYDYEKIEVDADSPFVSSYKDGKYFGWSSTKHKKQIYHISRSVILWIQALNDVQAPKYFREKYEDAIIHDILSHHGLKEWGSPVQPQTKVAWILHLCDSISARLYDGGQK